METLDEFIGPETRKQSPDHRLAVRCGDVEIGEGSFTVMAGPCAIEGLDQALSAAKVVEEAGAKVFRASLFKPRTSPYSFQGIGAEGIPILEAVRAETGLLLESEVLSLAHLELIHDHVDMLRVGARGMRQGAANKTLVIKCVANAIFALFDFVPVIFRDGKLRTVGTALLFFTGLFLYCRSFSRSRIRHKYLYFDGKMLAGGGFPLKRPAYLRVSSEYRKICRSPQHLKSIRKFALSQQKSPVRYIPLSLFDICTFRTQQSATPLMAMPFIPRSVKM